MSLCGRINPLSLRGKDIIYDAHHLLNSRRGYDGNNGV
jgi:hypothetical protein